ncbi:MAG: CoA-binding protein [Promethearchaeota archaeon]
MASEDKEFWEAVFNPRAVAVIGPSQKRGYYWLRSLMSGGYMGKIFGIHPKLGSALGIRFYKSILDVPDPVDFAVVAVPARAVALAVKECVEKGVRYITIFSSGFSELGDEGKHLEDALLEITRGTGSRINGPNCMGIYCPRGGLSFRTDLPMNEGVVGYVSQSGGIAIDVSLVLTKHEVGFSKVISCGNSIDLNVADYVEFLADDPRTKVIAIYLENLGKTRAASRRLLQVMKEANRKKPVVVWRGGITEQGAKAAASHTGALKTSSNIWGAIVKQTGIVSVRTFEEFVDTLMAFSMYLNRIPASNRVGLVSISGGLSVTHTDLLAELGLEVPNLSETTVRNILDDNMIQSVGISAQNPVDLGSSYFALSVVDHVLHDLANDPNVDSIVCELSNHYVYNVRVMAAFRQFPELFFTQMLKTLRSIRHKSKKPVFVALPVVAYEEEAIQDKKVFLSARFPVFPKVERAGRAIRNLLEYAAFRKKMEKHGD